MLQKEFELIRELEKQIIKDLKLNKTTQVIIDSFIISISF